MGGEPGKPHQQVNILIGGGVLGHVVVESQKEPLMSYLDSLVVVLGGGVEPDKTTNESLGFIGGGVELCGGGRGVESQKKGSLGLVGGGGGGVESQKKESLGLVGGGGGLHGSNRRVYCKTLVSLFF